MQLEACDHPQGFMMYHSTSGGTGSGFGGLLMQHVKTQHPSLCLTVMTNFNSPTLASSTLVPYNTIFASKKLMDHADVCIVFDNESIYNICKAKLGINKASYRDVNHLLSQVAASLTASFRFGSDRNVRLDELQRHLCVSSSSNLKFMIPSFAPTIRIANAAHERPSTADITTATFKSDTQMAGNCDDKYIAALLLYRGNVQIKEVNASIDGVKAENDVMFVDWNPNSMRHGINFHKSVFPEGYGLATPDRTVLNISHNFSVVNLFSRLDHKFDLMYAKRAFVHRYMAEGLEEGMFSEAREAVAWLEREYETESQRTIGGHGSDYDNQEY